jgi:hypothetical protein
MHALTAAELLRVWEKGFALTAPCRARSVLGVAAPETPSVEFGRLTLGQRGNLLQPLGARPHGLEFVPVVATAGITHISRRHRHAREFSLAAPNNHGVIAGNSLVYVQVDGVESVLQIDRVTNAYFKPKVKIP